MLWQREAHRGAPPQSRHLKNSYASETPTTDGERVYVLVRQRRRVRLRHGRHAGVAATWPARATRYGWGTAASPVLHDGRLYVLDDNDEHASLVALDARDRQGGVAGRARAKETNWATPFIWRHAQRTEIVIAATGGVQSYDLDGKPLWTLRGMSSIAIPTPFESGGLLYVTSGYVGDQVRPVYAIKPGASGDISLSTGETSNEFVAWYAAAGRALQPVADRLRRLYYTLLDRGFFTAHDARTGAEVYGRQRIDPAGVGFTASPWAANGRLYAVERGRRYLCDQGRAEYELLAKNSLGEMAMATPAMRQQPDRAHGVGALPLGGQ